MALRIEFHIDQYFSKIADLFIYGSVYRVHECTSADNDNQS